MRTSVISRQLAAEYLPYSLYNRYLYYVYTILYELGQLQDSRNYTQMSRQTGRHSVEWRVKMMISHLHKNILALPSVKDDSAFCRRLVLIFRKGIQRRFLPLCKRVALDQCCFPFYLTPLVLSLPLIWTEYLDSPPPHFVGGRGRHEVIERHINRQRRRKCNAMRKEDVFKGDS